MEGHIRLAAGKPQMTGIAALRSWQTSFAEYTDQLVGILCAIEHTAPPANPTINPAIYRIMT